MDRNTGENFRDDERDLTDTAGNESEREGIEDLGAGLTGGKNPSPGMGAGGGLGSEIRDRGGISGTGNSNMGVGVGMASGSAGGPTAAEHRNDPDFEEEDNNGD